MREDRHEGSVAALRRVRLIAQHTLDEALQLRLSLLLGMVGAGLVFAALGLREFNFGTAELNFLGDFGLGAIGLIGVLLAVLATAHLFFDGIAGGAAYCVLTRPVRRSEFLWGKFCGVAALLALFVGVLGLVMAGLVAWRAHQLGFGAGLLVGLGHALVVLWFKLTLIAAMTLLVCSYAGSALFASCAGVLLAMLGQLRPLAAESSRLAWLRAWPNLGLFDAEARFAASPDLATAWLPGLLAYWAGYVFVFGVLASYVFKRREF